MSTHLLKAMTTFTWPTLGTFTTDAPSFLLSLAGRKPWASVAMATMYQNPENWGHQKVQCPSCCTMLPAAHLPARELTKQVTISQGPAHICACRWTLPPSLGPGCPSQAKKRLMPSWSGA
jgi:hypothetical protein